MVDMANEADPDDAPPLLAAVRVERERQIAIRDGEIPLILAPLVTWAMTPGMSDDAARELAQSVLDAKEGASR
jgi:hypothetical protein